MAATQRVVVLMTPEQKSDVTKRARAQQLPVGEYMRRQALLPRHAKEADENAVLAGLADELAASTRRATLALDGALARLDESERRLPEIVAAARARAEAEFRGMDPERFAQLVQPGVGA